MFLKVPVCLDTIDMFIDNHMWDFVSTPTNLLHQAFLECPNNSQQHQRHNSSFPVESPVDTKYENI